MAAVKWPDTILPSKVMFHPDVPSASGGQSFSGAEQVVFSSAGRWRATLAMAIWRQSGSSDPANRILAARAMVAHFKGRTNTVYIGVYDEANAPSPLAGGGRGLVKTTHSDGTSFSDGSSYTQFQTPALLADAASKGDMAATITMLGTNQSAQAGQYFGLGDCELYLIDSSTNEGGGNFAVTFWPPLRSDHAANEVVNFDRMTCEMRLAADTSGQVQFTDSSYRADQELELVEAL